jgi:hypothetical protein
MKFLTNYFRIVVVRVSHRSVVYIVGLDISLLAAVVNQREVSLDLVEFSTLNLDLWRHSMNIFCLLKCSDCKMLG